MAMHNDLMAETKDDLVNFDSAQDKVLYICAGDSELADSPLRFYVYRFGDPSTANGDTILTNQTPDAGPGNYIETTIDYNRLANLPALFSGAYSDLSGKPTIPAAQVQSDWTAVTGLGVILNKPTITSYVAPTIHSAVSRSLNSAFTISSTLPAAVSYTVRIAYSVTILLGSTGSVSLQYSINGGTTYTTVSTVSNNIVLGLALSGYNDYVLSGEIPAGALVKLTSTTSNATNTYQTGQETY